MLWDGLTRPTYHMFGSYMLWEGGLIRYYLIVSYVVGNPNKLF